MKASELRIGNLLHGSGNQVLSVTRIYNEDRIGIGSGDPYIVSGDNPCLLPIPLTEEWLLKFGFDPYKKLNGCNGYMMDGWFVSADLCFMVLGSSVILSKMKYVHQLQNLYFALTGQELTLPEPPVK